MVTSAKSGTPEQPAFIILDLSGLIHAVLSRALTGVPRVELAYAQHLVATVPERLKFSALDGIGRLRLLDRSSALAFLDHVAEHWHQGIGAPTADHGIGWRARYLRAGLLLHPGRSLRRFVAGCGRRCIYVIPSQWVLERTSLIAALKRAGDLKLAYFVHDTLPLTHPQFFLANVLDRDRRRAENAARFADMVIVNSHATAKALSARLGSSLPGGRIVVAPLGPGLRPLPRPPSPPSDSPYFVMLGTIEPRKNHALMFAVWRLLRSELGSSTPRLVLIGHRGWANKRVFQLLDRDFVLREVVEERGRLPDTVAAELLAGARALLLPSFAEGYGLPLAEALSAGVPVVCSDIPVFREVGGAAPEYLDPTDVEGWRATIAAYAGAQSPRRNAQIARMTAWASPTWEQHFARVMAAINELDR